MDEMIDVLNYRQTRCLRSAQTHAARLNLAREIVNESDSKTDAHCFVRIISSMYKTTDQSMTSPSMRCTEVPKD
jgi:hypothetical protein